MEAFVCISSRNSLLNMTAILPDVFVRPDLGPRATISHGVGVRDSAPDVGTVHLHLEKADSLSALGENHAIQSALQS